MINATESIINNGSTSIKIFFWGRGREKTWWGEVNKCPVSMHQICPNFNTSEIVFECLKLFLKLSLARKYLRGGANAPMVLPLLLILQHSTWCGE